MSDNEEEFFFKQNQALIKKMRAQLELTQTADAIQAAESEVTAELATELAALGITADALPLMHLAPLLQVAWADGEVQPSEARLLRMAASDLTLSESAEALFEAALHTRPPDSFFEGALTFLQLTLAARSESESDAEIATLGEMVMRIAESAGGIFGIFGNVDGDEKAAIREIALRLESVQPDAARELLNQL